MKCHDKKIVDGYESLLTKKQRDCNKIIITY